MSVVWFGVGIAACGVVAAVVASIWTPAYQGPMTGLGPALLMMGGMIAAAIGVAVALVAWVVKRLRGSRAP